MVERKKEENQGMLKEEVMRDGMKKGVFREGTSPNERLDFGKHVGKTFREVYRVKGMNPAPHIHEHLRYTNMATANCVHPHAQHEHA